VRIFQFSQVAANKTGKDSKKGDQKGEQPKNETQSCPQLPPGCENPPKGIKMSDCCQNFPKFFSRQQMQNKCKDTCKDAAKGQGKCCKIDCSLNNAGVLTEGKFDAKKAKALLVNETKWDQTIIALVVDSCVAKGNLLFFPTNTVQK
jgi:hypothetical protein